MQIDIKFIWIKTNICVSWYYLKLKSEKTDFLEIYYIEISNNIDRCYNELNTLML